MEVTKALARWAAETPESFRFSIKMHQRVTHKLRLKDVKEAVSDFLAALEPLGPRLGVVLFQLPLALDDEFAVADADVEVLRVHAGEFRPEYQHIVLGVAFDLRYPGKFTRDL